MNQIPVIPMISILKQYAAARNLPLNCRNWESIMRTYQMYILDAQILN